MGIEHTRTPFKLLCLAVVLVLSNIMIKCLEYKYLTDILKEFDQDWDKYEFVEPEKRKSFRIFLHNLRIYSLFIIYYLSFLLP
jgi:hypothetical protein